MNDIVFKKENGGMGRRAASEDPVSGLVIALSGAISPGALAEWEENGFEAIVLAEADGEVTDALYVVRVSYYEQLKNTYGISPVDSPEDASQKVLNTVDYHVREFFRISPSGTLYLAVRPGNSVSVGDVEALQTYSGGSVRQMGLFGGTVALLSSYQEACARLEGNHQPLSLLVTYAGRGSYAGSVVSLSTLRGGSNHVSAGRSNVSILAGCDLDPALVARLGDFAYFGCIGNALGALSKAAVNESIAWVQKFPLGLSVPGFISGDLLKNVSAGDRDLIDGNRYIFVRTYEGDSGCYYNDSHTLDVKTSDYAFIENVRTMDKATRGIRTNLLPWLNAPLYVDASTGRLRPDTVAFLEATASRALEDMEKAGELSGYKVEIDPEQNVLATSLVEVVIKNVPVGVMRKVTVKIGFATAV
jgi:hypothetical protein